MRCLNCNLIVPKGEKVCPICGCDLTVNRDSDFVFYDDEHEPHCVKHRHLWFFTAVVVLAVALSFFLIQKQ